MEISEKLDTFFRAAIEAANGKSAEILEEQKTVYEESIASYEKKKQEELATRVRIAENQVEKEENRIVSEQILNIKKEYHSRQDERKRELFLLVEKRLNEYRKTEEYRGLLQKKIEKIRQYAGEDEVEIYIDPEDEKLAEELMQKTGYRVLLGSESFGGGIRAVIRSRNLLIDESFGRKLAEEKEKFSF